MSLVVPAVLPASREEFERTLSTFAGIPSVSRIQIDVVDGRLASPASWPYSAEATQGTPYPELEAMVKEGKMLPHLDRIAYEIDLMCMDPEAAAAAWLSLGATRLIFHVEVTVDIGRLLASVRKRYGSFISLGLALNVATDPAIIEGSLGSIDFVQFMGIARIGVQGQPFDARVLTQVRTFHTKHPEVAIQVDGGVSLESAKKLVALGVTNVVVGSGILRASNPAAAFAALEALETSYGV